MQMNVKRKLDWGRLGDLVKRPTLDFGSGCDLMVHGVEPRIRLCTDSVEPAWDSLSPCLSLLLPNSHSLPLKINLKKKEIRSSNI